MKRSVLVKRFFIGFTLIMFIGFTGISLAKKPAGEKSRKNTRTKKILKSQNDKVSYGIGLDIGRNFKRQFIEINPDILIIGIKDAMTGNSKLMTDEEIRKVMSTFRKEMMGKKSGGMKKVSTQNREEGKRFLAKNKKRKGVKVLRSGLQYRVITEGKGKIPESKDTVTVHYKGRLIDGTEFDSSIKRGKPALFPVTGVIPGWTQALKMMKVGSKWEIYVPSELAYGERGMGRNIGPNATLIFEIELLSIKEEEKE